MAENSGGIHKIIQVRTLTESTFVLRFTRGEIIFRAGQRILAGPAGEMDQRDYSIYSGENDDYLEILLKEIPFGNVSVRLRYCKPGDLLQVNGPFGSFVPEAYDLLSRKFIFIATGTGISPFHSIIRSYPGIDYTIIHGIRYRDEAYERREYETKRYIICTSREAAEGRKGRVTDFLPSFRISPEMLFFLCGNSSMIYDVSHLLKNRGIPPGNILSEIYF
ncbi:MAG TPA: FAD-binding oxidoreductase [Bacteroidales bacterium]|jgi:ferredoxin--NADP+ reductase/benzoate/toluate 1,2-dioxygenase reductase subunit|nr:FAD-binding oxidoreductase [Bacteroidales bacterium]